MVLGVSCSAGTVAVGVVVVQEIHLCDLGREAVKGPQTYSGMPGLDCIVTGMAGDQRGSSSEVAGTDCFP